MTVRDAIDFAIFLGVGLVEPEIRAVGSYIGGICSTLRHPLLAYHSLRLERNLRYLDSEERYALDRKFDSRHPLL